jgi:hypothetical protein
MYYMRALESYQTLSQGAMDVGTAYEDFKAVEEGLEKLKKEHHHPLRVCNSQSTEDYNRKRINSLPQQVFMTYVSLIPWLFLATLLKM